MHSNLYAERVTAVRCPVRSVRAIRLFDGKTRQHPDETVHPEQTTVEHRINVSDICLTQQAIVKYCLKRQGQMFLPSELYRCCKKVRRLIDEQIELDNHPASGDPCHLHVKTIFRQSSGMFETVFSPAQIIWDYCQGLANQQIGMTIGGSRYTIPKE